MEHRRVFIGLPAGKALCDAAGVFRRSHRELQVRWIPREHLHVTLVPPWALTDPGPACRVLERFASGAPAIPVRFDLVSAGPDPGSPRLVWATGKAPESLTRLASRLNATFSAGGGPERGFLLHLTLARLDRQRIGHVTGLREAVGWVGSLDTLVLYESILKPDGVGYRMLCDDPLGRL
jgi:2'-5' RNA ligase